MVVTIFVAALLVMPATSMAHAVLDSSTPARGAHLNQPPAGVIFEFNEPVEASFGAVRVFDTKGNQVQTGEVERPGGSSESIGIALRDGLGSGAYTATYRVVSADSHPVTGGIVFTVGKDGPASGKTISELIAESDTGKVTEVAFWFDRWVGYLAIAVAVGLLSFLLLLWRPISGKQHDILESVAPPAGRAMRTIFGVALASGILATCFSLVFQGATAAGTSFWTALEPDVVREVLDTRFGEVMTMRLVGWVGLIPLFFCLGSIVRRQGLHSPVALISLVRAALLVMTPSLAGHASTQDPAWLLLPSDVLHVAAMSVWVGGLAALVWVLPVATRRIEARSDRSVILVAFLLRFSTIALIAVVVIGISGTVQAILEINSFSALVTTAFGRAVLAKIALFLLLVFFGAINRKKIIPALVGRRSKGSSPGKPGISARRNLRIEVVLVTLVLAVTAALVSFAPPGVALSGPVSGSVAAGPDRLEYTVDPARVGSNEVHIYMFDDKTGAPADIKSLEVSFELPDADIPPIPTEIEKAGPGHYVIPSALLAVKGDWVGEAAVRLSTFNEPVVRFEVPVR